MSRELEIGRNGQPNYKNYLDAEDALSSNTVIFLSERAIVETMAQHYYLPWVAKHYLRARLYAV
jgi:hypothetical protein